MFFIPTWWLRTHSDEQIKLAMDFRLDCDDVAEILHVMPPQVTRWARGPQRRHRPLKSRQYHGSPARAYRLGDVTKFAADRGLTVDLSGVPAVLREEWGIDLPDKPDRLDSIERRSSDGRN